MCIFVLTVAGFVARICRGQTDFVCPCFGFCWEWSLVVYCTYSHGLEEPRKLHIWYFKRCASQFCHSKHRLRKNGTPNIRHLIILPFGVFSLFSFSFSCIWEGEMPLLPLCICVSLYTNRLVADRSYRLSRSCLS